VAGGSRADLRPGEEKLSAVEAGAGHARDAPRAQADLKVALQRLGFSGWLNTAFIERVNLMVRDARVSAGSPYLGNSEARPTPPSASRVVACLLSFCTSPCSATSGARAAASAWGQAGGATLSTANSGDGSWKNASTMDGARGAHLPLAAGFCLRATQAKCGCRSMSWRGR
jgi:hypothetical protein